MKQIIPSTPLITCDPYFSLWSSTNELTASKTCHWTGVAKEFDGYVTIDGIKYRFMGTDETAPAIEQTSLEITATKSQYQFKTDTVQLTVVFRTPLLLTDLDLTSRPVSYMTFSTVSLDSKEHEISVLVKLDEGHCYDGNDAKPMLGDIHHCDGFKAVWMGQKKQAPLSNSGDGITIDWGYLYLAAPSVAHVGYCTTRSFKSATDRHTLICDYPLNAYADKNGDGMLVIGYNDIASIQYFGDTLKGYWARNGKTMLQALGEAISEYRSVFSRCDIFDESLQSEAEQIGTASYAKVCACAYRQTIAAHKLVADKDGNVIFVSKECFSNGCAVTVDISYPSSPLFLRYQPELVKGMLRPVFRFANLPAWEYDFAPHDVGRFPYVWGQVYGLKEYRVDNGETFEPFYSYPAGSNLYDFKSQMPVEESGNMLILTAAVAIADGDVGFVKENMPTLQKWVTYLIEYGADPGNQLCTDDFAGHLAHNVNLASKAIMGIEAYSILLLIIGKTVEAEQYHQKAATMANDWEKRATVGNRTVLAFGDTDSFSLKYNLIWDKLFGSELFSDTLYEKELACYLEKMNAFGVPLDSRKDYTKSDWLIWAGSFADDREVLAKFAEPLVNFLENAPSRNPFSDWFDTITAKQQPGFQNRTVQGGLFMPLLKKKMNEDQCFYPQ